MCVEVTRFWRSPLKAFLLLLVVVSCIALTSTTPTHYSSGGAGTTVAPAEGGLSADTMDNGLRQTHRPRTTHGRQSRRHSPKILCGKALREEIAKVCNGRGYNDMASPSPAATNYPGASDHCCHIGCTRMDLDRFCKPASSDSPALISDEEMSQSASSEIESPVPSYNQLRTNPVEQKEPTSVSVGTNIRHEPRKETENALVSSRDMKHTFEVKTSGHRYRNSPVTPRRTSSIRR